MSDQFSKLALVTGASRGVGAEVARQLARSGVDVVINYRSKAPRAQKVADAVAASGQRAWLAPADITSAADISAMMNVVREAGALNTLILNASGGLEKDAAPDYAMQLNLHAQISLADAALPLMARGGRIVFVTSHLAHFYHERPMDNLYAPVAASKRAGEDALRAKIDEFAAQDVSLVVVSGDMIEGTITPKLLERANRGTIETRREQAGQLPDVEEFARAIVAASTDENLASGATVYVGNVD